MLNVYFNFKLCVSVGRSGLTSDILCRGAAHSPLCQTYFNSVVLGIVLTLLIILETFLFACQVFNIWIEAIKVSISIKFRNKVFSCANNQWKFGPWSESLQVTTSHIHVMSPGIPYSFVSKTYVLNFELKNFSTHSFATVRLFCLANVGYFMGAITEREPGWKSNNVLLSHEVQLWPVLRREKYERIIKMVEPGQTVRGHSSDFQW